MHEILLQNNGSLLALDHNEDILVINGILAIDKFVPPQEHWYPEFKERYFNQGAAMLPRQLRDLNLHLRRRGCQLIEFVSSLTDGYSTLRGEEKAQERCALRDRLLGMTAPERDAFVTTARNNAALLPPITPPDPLFNPVVTKSLNETTHRFASMMNGAATVAKETKTTLTLPGYRVVFQFASAGDALAFAATHQGQIEVAENGHLIRVMPTK